VFLIRGFSGRDTGSEADKPATGPRAIVNQRFITYFALEWTYKSACKALSRSRQNLADDLSYTEGSMNG
jgi:hypothetical protein